jgi:hypothetical protein
MPPVGFEPMISAGERPQTNALHRAAIGTGTELQYTTVSNSMKIRPAGAGLLHLDGRTDERTESDRYGKANSRFL